MGILVNGQWQTMDRAHCDATGHFIRQESLFRSTVSRDHNSQYPAQPHRYHLYISYACPWACRTLVFRKLKGLEKIISFSAVEPVVENHGWEFGSSNSQTHDPIHHADYLYELYLKSDPHYTGKVTVPVLWDKEKNSIVNNESADIIRMLNAAFNDYAETDQDFYPLHLQDSINSINHLVYENINNGVYRCGFAKTQTAYEEAFDQLFAALDLIEKRLAQQRYLVGHTTTEADWRLFTTLIRFDTVYYLHFKCNLKRIDDYPHLSHYLRELYQYPGIKETVNFFHIKEHYYRSHKNINPSGLVPKGPAVNYEAAHNRAAIPGEPFSH